MATSWDSDGNGIPEVIRVDANGDGYDETVALDSNENGRFEAALVDTDPSDGDAEIVMYDTDEDGTFDSAVVDSDNDGYADRYIDLTTAGAVPEMGAVVGPATSLDPVAGLVLDLAAHTGQVAYGTPDSDSDGYSDAEDAAPFDPYHA